MPAQFTVAMTNGLGGPIKSGDVSVEAEIPSGWRLVYEQDEVQYEITTGVPNDIPLAGTVAGDEQMEMTFIVGPSPAHPSPNPPKGELRLVFLYDDRPLREVTLYLPPGREPTNEE